MTTETIPSATTTLSPMTSTSSIEITTSNESNVTDLGDTCSKEYIVAIYFAGLLTGLVISCIILLLWIYFYKKRNTKDKGPKTEVVVQPAGTVRGDDGTYASIETLTPTIHQPQVIFDVEPTYLPTIPTQPKRPTNQKQSSPTNQKQHSTTNQKQHNPTNQKQHSPTNQKQHSPTNQVQTIKATGSNSASLGVPEHHVYLDMESELTTSEPHSDEEDNRKQYQNTMMQPSPEQLKMHKRKPTYQNTKTNTSVQTAGEKGDLEKDYENLQQDDEQSMVPKPMKKHVNENGVTEANYANVDQDDEAMSIGNEEGEVYYNIENGDIRGNGNNQATTSDELYEAFSSVVAPQAAVINRTHDRLKDPNTEKPVVRNEKPSVSPKPHSKQQPDNTEMYGDKKPNGKIQHNKDNKQTEQMKQELLHMACPLQNKNGQSAPRVIQANNTECKGTPKVMRKVEKEDFSKTANNKMTHTQPY